MRLYKYTAPRWASVLETRRIRFTQPIYFNDPFELAPSVEAAIDTSFEDRLIREVLESIAADPNAGGEHYRAALADSERATGLPLSTLFPYEEQISALVPIIPDLMRAMLRPASAEIGRTFYGDLRDRIARSFGVLSLAEVPTSLLMWAHYGDEHRGLVIGFHRDHPFFNRQLHAEDFARHARPVVYTPDRPRRPIVYDPGDDEAAFAERLARDFFLVKSPEWSYEREWRMLLPASGVTEVRRSGDQDLLLEEFPQDAVAEVILGCRASQETEAEVHRILAAPEYRHVELRRARLHPELFQLVLEPSTPPDAG